MELAGPLDRLVVEEGRVRPCGELRVRRVDAAVDERDRHAGAGGRRRVGADVGEPPLLPLKRVAGNAARRRSGSATGEEHRGEHDEQAAVH